MCLNDKRTLAELFRYDGPHIINHVFLINFSDVIQSKLQSFADHVFLDDYIEEFPNIPSIRHFMELVSDLFLNIILK